MNRAGSGASRAAGSAGGARPPAGRGAVDSVHLRGVQHRARHRRAAGRSQPPRRRAGRRADYAAAAGFRPDGIPPRQGSDRRRPRRRRAHAAAHRARHPGLMEISPGVTLAVLGAALLHASWNVLVKSGADKELETIKIAIGSGLGALAAGGSFPAPARVSWPWLAASAAVHILFFIFLAGAYRW